MADAYDLLLSALLKDEGSYQTENPFYSAGTGIDAVLATMPKYHLKPWEAVLAGALGGFGSGVLKGIGTASADQKTASIAEKLSSALMDGNAADTLSQDPELAKYAPIAKIADLQQKRELEQVKAKLEVEMANKPKTLQTIPISSTMEQEAYVGADGKPVFVGSPRPIFNPTDSSATHAIPSTVAERLAKSLMDAQGIQGPVDPSLVDTYSNDRTAALNNQIASMGAGRERSENAADRGSRVSEKTAGEISGLISLTEDIRAGLGQAKGAFNGDPGLVEKKLNQLPTGSDAYNAFSKLQVSGAQAAKLKEGRVNDTTLELYTNYLTSRDLEPLGAVIKRGNDFADSLVNEAQNKIDAMRATGRNVDELQKQLDRVKDTAASNVGGAPPNMSFEEFKRWKRGQ